VKIGVVQNGSAVVLAEMPDSPVNFKEVRVPEDTTTIPRNPVV